MFLNQFFLSLSLLSHLFILIVQLSLFPSFLTLTLIFLKDFDADRRGFLLLFLKFKDGIIQKAVNRAIA